jgi:hypothetical protein
MAGHNHGTALIFARTETDVWQDFIFPKASAILFLRRRLTFFHADGTKPDATAGAPSALIAYGPADAEALHVANLRGALRGYIVSLNR